MNRPWLLPLLLLLSVLMTNSAQAQSTIEQVIASTDKHWASRRFKTRTESVRGFLVPLGSMKKLRGVWRLETFEPVDGELERLTWEVSGEPVSELFLAVSEQLDALGELKWECDGRSCGNGAEWASRVYQERLLYGRDEFIRYAAYKTAAGTWLTLFSAARTADRQYLHLDVITPAGD